MKAMLLFVSLSIVSTCAMAFNIYPSKSQSFVKYTTTEQGLISLQVCSVSDPSKCDPNLIGGRPFYVDEINTTIKKINDSKLSVWDGGGTVLVGIGIGFGVGSLLPGPGNAIGAAGMGILALVEVVRTNDQADSAAKGLAPKPVGFGGSIATLLDILNENLPK